MFRLDVLIELIRPGTDADAAQAAALLPRISDPAAKARAVEQLARYHMNSGLDGRELGRAAVADAVSVGDPDLEATARITLEPCWSRTAMSPRGSRSWSGPGSWRRRIPTASCGSD